MKIYFFKRSDSETIIDYQSIQYDSVGASMRAWPFPDHEPWDPRYTIRVIFHDGAMYIVPPASERGPEIGEGNRRSRQSSLTHRPRRVFFYLLIPRIPWNMKSATWYGLLIPTSSNRPRVPSRPLSFAGAAFLFVEQGNRL